LRRFFMRGGWMMAKTAAERKGLKLLDRLWRRLEREYGAFEVIRARSEKERAERSDADALRDIKSILDLIVSFAKTHEKLLELILADVFSRDADVKIDRERLAARVSARIEALFAERIKLEREPGGADGDE
jgi:hypothetical protein